MEKDVAINPFQDSINQRVFLLDLVVEQEGAEDRCERHRQEQGTENREGVSCGHRPEQGTAGPLIVNRGRKAQTMIRVEKKSGRSTSCEASAMRSIKGTVTGPHRAR